ncbi:probable ascorbate-specific transmembrane electron transporter 1 [Impatiens glandulifera]|uniref:probable ascorbate-specific transmembrane electron transporter 1 n=1 Tax=Impatiens glandulifera TaxID=253017 RepID=UPI001FB152D8|nr:probable ascorbate-specific transmembrane electron transporter 1 [Impatiens glandulifera]
MAIKNSSSFNLSAAPSAFLAQLLIISVTVLVLIWVLHFREGIAFNSQNKFKIFNLHPLFMAVGFLLIAGEAIMTYKILPAGNRKLQKGGHLLLHLIALICGILGIYVVFKFNNETSGKHLYTFHSWIGLSSVALFGFQWILGFFSFWWPRAEMGARARLAPWHVFFGIVIFLIVVLSVETGLVEIFTILVLTRSQEALIVNFIGVLVLLFAVSVGLTVILPRSYNY